MTDSVLVRASRDVRGSLDRTDDPNVRGVVLGCPPHPQHGGTRHDPRLTAVGDAVTEAGIDCLRFDYGPWDEGDGERSDAEAAIEWARERYDRVGLFGYSFGASIALLAAERAETDTVAALAPTATLGPDLDAVAALESIDCAVQVVYGSRDDTVDWEPVVEHARTLGADVEELPADHFFVGQLDRIADRCGTFLTRTLTE